MRITASHHAPVLEGTPAGLQSKRDIGQGEGWIGPQAASEDGERVGRSIAAALKETGESDA